jgi:hypothetical protein
MTSRTPSADGIVLKPRALADAGEFDALRSDDGKLATVAVAQMTTITTLSAATAALPSKSKDQKSKPGRVLHLAQTASPYIPGFLVGLIGATTASPPVDDKSRPHWP